MAYISSRRIGGSEYVYINSSRIRTESGSDSHYLGRKDSFTKKQLEQIKARFDQMEQNSKPNTIITDLRNGQTDVNIKLKIIEMQPPVDRTKNGKALKVCNALVEDEAHNPMLNSNTVCQLALWGDKEIDSVKAGDSVTIINGICTHYMSKTDGKLYITISKGKYGVMSKP